jgi:N12 class adenine-specific DNA methylase
MKAKPKDVSLWLPGFDINEDPAYPELFDDKASPKAFAPTLLEQIKADPVASETSLPSAWRPSLPSPASTAQLLSWPTWSDSTLSNLDSKTAKFEANLKAVAALHSLESFPRVPSAEDREALLRFTGWGGLPEGFNMNGYDLAWVSRAKQLRSALTPERYESALASVNTSHYTEPFVIRWIWQALRRLGFDGGRILEPSSGTGLFLGCMPGDIAQRSNITAVEPDHVPASILKMLYEPLGVDVRAQGFESAQLADSSFDLVVSNVPFGNYQVSDGRNRPYSHFSIHNWFVGRALDLVRPGGLVCFITSTSFLDAHNDAVRALVASQAGLVGAVRLPSGTFSRLGSTDTQADIVILQKGVCGEATSIAWLDLDYVPDSMRHPHCYDEHMRINAWFVAHPDAVMGKISKASNGYAAVPTAVLDDALEPSLNASLGLLPQGAYKALQGPSATATASSTEEVVSAPDGTRLGSFLLHKGRLHVATATGLADIEDKTGATVRRRIVGMCEIRDIARKLLNAQLEDVSDLAIAGMRRDLNASYDRYVKSHGCLTGRANALAFRRDPNYPLLLALEHYDEEKDAASKAAIFHTRTINRIVEPTQAAEPIEALALSMQWRGHPDLGYMAKLLRADEDAVAADLMERGMLFKDPDSSSFETADAYLSGNVKRKLRAAVSAGPTFAMNVQALEKVIPEDLPPSSIEARLGAVWIPAETVEAFIKEVLGIPSAAVRYLAKAGAWSVKYNKWEAERNVTCSQELGTARVNALELVLSALNVQTPTVRDQHPTEDTHVVNKTETLAAREKFGLLKDRFAKWAFDDLSRRERLCRIYNDLFNATRPRVFDGSHMKLPGFSQCFVLHPHQRNAIWRIVQTGNTGLFHAVGAGKTAVMVAATMEMRRLGLANKPVHVVPNHMLEQYTAEFVRLYPCASVLMASKDDLAVERRREFAARIATGNWDAIVMTHSTFELISLSVEYTKRFIKSIIFDLEMAVRASKSDDRSNRIVKQLERMKKTWKVRLERLENQKKKDDFLTWESLGIDSVCYDEAHYGKNLFRHTKMARIAGLPLANSQRAFDLYLKTRYTMSLYGGQHRGVVLATATPVANSMAEIHTFQRYLQPDRLEELGLEQFDAWAATFGETVTALEIAPDGSGYRLNTRFARFINVPDLMTIFGEVADIRTSEMLKLPVPRLKGEKPRTVTCPASASLKEFVASLVKRAEKLKTSKVDPRHDNMLKITNDGRKAALDMRMVDPFAACDPEGKVNACAGEVERIWRSTASFKGAQLVFCDLSTPKDGKEFSVYEDLRDALIYRGLPAEEIAFIHDADTDAQKAVLFRKLREGKVRLALASTSKMGVGTNVQKRLVALHELDCPWRPCDVEQREGRILRQGNECDEVEIIRYVTAGSFDAYSWQTCQTKAKFITQVMSGDKGLRSVEDVELATLSYAEVKALASGNPKVIEKAGVDAEIAKYASLFSVWRDQRYRNESDVAHLPFSIESSEALEVALAADWKEASTVLSQGDLTATVHGKRCVGSEELGHALRTVIMTARSSVLRHLSEERVGNVGDFDLYVHCSSRPDETHLYLKRKAAHDCSPYQTGPALFSSLLATLREIEERLAATRHRLKTYRDRLVALQEELAKPFEHEDRLTTLLGRQRELAKELDLDKDEAGTEVVEATEESLAA